MTQELIKELKAFTETIEGKCATANEVDLKILNRQAKSWVFKVVNLLTGFDPKVHVNMPPQVVSWILMTLREDVYDTLVKSQLRVILDLDEDTIRATIVDDDASVQIRASIMTADEELLDHLHNEPLVLGTIH